MTPIIDSAKTIFAIASAGVFWIAETVTPDIPGVPAWVTALGLPVAFLIAVIYALVGVFKMLRESQNGRLTDRDKYEARLEDFIAKGNDSRERLIRATDNQTQAFQNLGDQLKSRPCQKINE